MLQEKIIGLLIGKGVALSNDASDTEIRAALANAVFPPEDTNGADKLSRKAHGAGVEAKDKSGYLKAAAAHAKAADAQEATGNKKLSAAHDAMSDAYIEMAKVSSPGDTTPDNPSDTARTQNPPTPNNPPSNMTYSKLLGCDPATVTPAKAVAVWQQEISRLVREDGISLSDAWNQLKGTEPDLFARFNQVPLKPSKAALDNDVGTPRPPMLQTLLAQKPFITGALHLPANVDNDVLTAAVQANGGQWVKAKPMKIWTALHVLTMQKNPGLSLMDSRAKMVDDYSELSKFAGQMPGQVAAASGQS